jgi:hypothetical protein
MKLVTVFVIALTILWACADDEPPAPYNVTATSGNGGADLRWESGAADRFVIQRSEGTNYNFVPYAWTRGSQRFFYDYDVIPNEWYYYRVAGFYEEWRGEEGVYSPYSPEVGVEIK